MDVKGRTVWVMAKGYWPDEGGMQTYARSVAEAYAALDARVTVFTQTSAGPRNGHVGPVQIVDIGPDTSPLVLVKLMRALRRQQRVQGRPALLHATTWRTSVPPLLAGLPYVTTFHGREFMYARGLARRAMNLVARKAQRVVAVSHFSGAALARRIPGLPKAPLIAWNGTTAELEAGKRTGGNDHVPHILSLCRLEPRKNIAAAVEAAAICHREGKAFRFTLCGRGPEYESIRTLVKERGLEGVIDVAGYVDQQRAVTLYRDADIFLHPQIAIDGGRDFEGFGIAIADAMYAGAAVIVGKEGGPAELVEDGVTGLVVDGRSVDSIAAAMRRLIDSAELRHAMADAGAARAKDAFRWDRHVTAILASLASV